jgi:hypothetical protein
MSLKRFVFTINTVFAFLSTAVFAAEPTDNTAP